MNPEAFFSLLDKYKQNPHDFAVWVYTGVMLVYSREIQEGQSFADVLCSDIFAYFKEEEEDEGNECFKGADISSVTLHLLELAPYMKPISNLEYKLDRSLLPDQSDKLAVDLIIKLAAIMFAQ